MFALQLRSCHSRFYLKWMKLPSGELKKIRFSHGADLRAGNSLGQKMREKMGKKKKVNDVLP